ncbi:UPF0462 protein C4orf33 homolog [Stylophora pistillata]|uniref:UPF0462 protein C4orf33 homolog n=1 Tax=Stylophora pistillata TaxID=50429 RepID=UPI000C03F814|nr:UPF0462 protein C4orf33 homolog [Stylophora pistillata]
MNGCKELTFSITTNWNGDPVDHSPVVFRVGAADGTSVRVDVSGPLFNDPGPPAVASGGPCPELWEYEVAEIFFLGDKEKYLEVELCPLHQDKLALSYTANTDDINKTWKGRAIIPLEYFPPDVTKINAYAIHGSGNGRQYEALHPASKEFHTPDFHRLQFFKEFDFKALFPTSWIQPESTHWTNI